MQIKHYLFAGILPVLLLTGCMGGLPSCGSSDAEDLVKKIINQRSFLLGQFVSLDDVEETAVNHDAEIRVCSAKLTTTKGSENITYSIKWQNKDKSSFYLEIN